MTTFGIGVGSALRGWTSSLCSRVFTMLLEGALDGLEIEARYHALSRRSTPDLAKLGLKREDIAQAALKDAYGNRQRTEDEERLKVHNQNLSRAAGAARLKHRRAV